MSLVCCTRGGGMSIFSITTTDYDQIFLINIFYFSEEMRLSVPSGEEYDVVFTTGYWSERLTAFWSTNPDGLWNNNTEVSLHNSLAEYMGHPQHPPPSP